MTAYSPEPREQGDGLTILDANGQSVCEFKTGDSRVIRRVLACVNACAEICTEDLENLKDAKAGYLKERFYDSDWWQT